MKKSLIALAALGAFAGAASAQSSVTLFGVVDLSLLATSNGGGKMKSMASNSYNGNRLGFRGVEDLGGGLKGAFHLEAGMGNDVGSVGSVSVSTATGFPAAGGSLSNSVNNKIFNRRSTLSLMGNFGEVRLGRDYTPQFWNTTVFDAFGTNGPGSSLNISTAGANALGSGAGTFARADNSLGYHLPGNLGGLYGQVQISAPEAATVAASATAAPTQTNGSNKHTSLRVGYAAGPFNVAFASGKTETGANDYKQTNLGASYKFGFGTLMGYTNKSTVGAASEKLVHLGAWVPFGATTLRAGYTQSKSNGFVPATAPAGTVFTPAQAAAATNAANGANARDAKQFALGVVYDLSKRTAVYADVSRITNAAAVAAVAGTAATAAQSYGAAYSNGGLTNTPGSKASAFDVGVRHSF